MQVRQMGAAKKAGKRNHNEYCGMGIKEIAKTLFGGTTEAAVEQARELVAILQENL